MPLDSLDALDSVLAEAGVGAAQERLDTRAGAIAAEVGGENAPLSMRAQTRDAVLARMGRPTMAQRESANRIRQGKAAGREMGFFEGAGQAIDEVMLPAAAFAAKAMDGDNFAAIDEAVGNINEEFAARSSTATNPAAVAGQIAGAQAPMVPVMAAAAAGGIPAAIVEGASYAPMMMGAAEEAINKGATTGQALAESVIHPLAMAGGMRIGGIRQTPIAAPTAGRALLEGVAQAPQAAARGVAMGAATAALREPALAAVQATVDREAQPDYNPSEGALARIKGDLAMAIINPIAHAAMAPLAAKGVFAQQEAARRRGVEDARLLSRPEAAPAEPVGAKVADLEQRLAMSEDAGDLPPEMLSSERARLPSLQGQSARRAQILADLDAQRAAGAEEGAARQNLVDQQRAQAREEAGALRMREARRSEQYAEAEQVPGEPTSERETPADVAARNAQLEADQRAGVERQRAQDILAQQERAKRASAIDRQVEQDLRASQEAEAASREEGDLTTEASAAELERRLEAEAQARTERGGKLDIAKVELTRAKDELTRMEETQAERPSIADATREARTRIENEILQARSQRGDMAVDMRGVERPVDRSVLKANAKEINERVRVERDRAIAADKESRKRIADHRAAIRAEEARIRAEDAAMREEVQATKRAAAEQRRAVPTEPAEVRRRSQDATIPEPAKPSTSERLRAVYEAHKAGRLTREEAQASAARIRAEAPLATEATGDKPVAKEVAKEAIRVDTGPSPSRFAAKDAEAPAYTPAAAAPERAPAAAERAGAAPIEPSTVPSGRPAPEAAVSTAKAPAEAGEAASPGQIEQRGLEVELAKAKAKGANLRQEGAGTDAERARLDAEHKNLTADARSAVDRAKVAQADAAGDAQAEARRVAAQAVDVAQRRVALAQERLNRAKGEPADEQAARNELLQSQIDHENARNVKVEADNLTKTAKRDVAQEQIDEKRRVWAENAARIAPDVESGLRAAIDPDGSLVVDAASGWAVFRSKDGRDLVTVTLKMDPYKLTADDFGRWAESMGGRDGVVRWLNRTPEGKRALRMLNGKRPADIADISRWLGPDELVKFMELAAPTADYNPATGEIRIYDMATLSNVDAAAAGMHEGNHRITHGILLSALKTPALAKHLDTLVRAVGVDPREKGKLVPFLEKVRALYEQWRPSYDRGVEQTRAAKAKQAAEKIAGSRVWRALDAVRRAIGSFASMIRKVLPKGDTGGMNLDDVFKEMANGQLTSEAIKPVSGTSEERAFALKGADEESTRRPLVPGEERYNRSLGEIDEASRGVIEDIISRYERPKETMTGRKIDEAAAAEIDKAGSLSKAAADIVAEARAARGNETERPAQVRVLERRINELADRFRKGGDFAGGELNRLVSAWLEMKGQTGAELASYRDRLETPQQRADAVRSTFWRPNLRQARWFKAQSKRIAKFEAQGDTAGARRAGEVYDRAMDRFVEVRKRQIEKMREWGIDITDGPSLEKLLDGPAFQTVMRDIENLSLDANPEATTLDWIAANYRGHLLGDPIITQTQQIASNALASLEGVLRQGLTRPGSVVAAFRSGALKAAVENAWASYKEGKNAWVGKLEGEELGKVENRYSPKDWYSTGVRKVSFDLMAAIDGGFQRFNAQMEAAALVYDHARERGQSIPDAVWTATAATKNGMSHEIAIEALFRSLPTTFQELSIARPDAHKDTLDGMVKGAQSALTAADDGFGRFLGRVGLNSVDPITGEGRSIPLSTMVFPFVRTPLAIARAASRRSLLGAGSIVHAYAKLREAKAGGGKEEVAWAKEQMLRRGFESLLVGGLLTHAAAALLDATGTQVDDKDASYTGRDKPDKTVNLFGSRISYSRLEPFATPLAMAANGMKAIEEGKNPVPAELEALMKLGADLAWFRAIAGVGQVVQDVKAGRNDVFGSVASRAGEGAASTIVSATPVVGQAGLRNMLKPGDQMTRQDKPGFVGTLESEFGGNRVPVRDLWGRKVERGPVSGSSPIGALGERALAGAAGRAPVYRPTDVDRWVQAKGFDIPGWKPTGDDKKALKGRELDAFVEKAGPKLLTALRSIMQEEPNIDNDALKKVVNAIKHGIAAEVRAGLTDGEPMPDTGDEN